jgi:hypothetical protein
LKQSEFKEKYKDYLEDRYYGCELINEEALDYLDNKFQEYIKIPGFKYKQIKSKWNYFCFYADGLSNNEREEVELKLKEICDNG